MLGSSFTLAVDVGDVRACSYSSSAGSSFTLITGGDGDSTGRVSACFLDWIRKGENWNFLKSLLNSTFYNYIMTNDFHDNNNLKPNIKESIILAMQAFIVYLNELIMLDDNVH